MTAYKNIFDLIRHLFEKDENLATIRQYQEFCRTAKIKATNLPKNDALTYLQNAGWKDGNLWKFLDAFSGM